MLEAVTHGWYENANLFQSRFEKAFADYLGVPFALSLPSCTSALHLSLLALGVGPGDEVIVPDVTWIASAAPIVYQGATPVFADMDPVSWCLSAETVAPLVTPRTRAIIAVHLYGNMPQMNALRELATSRNIALIEDAAQAIGSRYQDQLAGSIGDMATFSFHGSKTMTTGEGGMWTTRRRDLYERALVIRDHGRVPGGKQFYNAEVGHKMKMSGLQAALGLAQLERIDELVARKRQIFAWYQARAHRLPGMALNADLPGVYNSYWMPTLVWGDELGVDKERLLAHMSSRQIDCRPFFYPLSSLPAFQEEPQAEAARNRNWVSRAVSSCGINLPSGLTLSEDQVETVVAALREFVAIRP